MQNLTQKIILYRTKQEGKLQQGASLKDCEYSLISMELTKK